MLQRKQPDIDQGASGYVILRQDVFHFVPECSRVIADFAMRQFMDDHVLKEWWREKEESGID